MIFPTGTVSDARTVITEFKHAFSKNAGLMPLVWSLGSHFKTLLGFWPHMMMEYGSGRSKSTLVKSLERTIGMTVFSGPSLQTEFRLLTSISHTSHPVGWEELSARRQDVIEKAVALLRESYQYTTMRRGVEMTEYLLCAPVLLVGEDVPVRHLMEKIVRTDLAGKKGRLIPNDLPHFPVRGWLDFLAKLSRNDVLDRYTWAKARYRIYMDPIGTAGELHISDNYAAVYLAWLYLCEYVGIESDSIDFDTDLIAEMKIQRDEFKRTAA
jgi:hypothetical protein